MTLSLSVGLPTFGDALGGDWTRLLALARHAEDAGIDRVVVTDHVVLGPDTAGYPWGRFPVTPDAPWLEPLTALTAIAAATTTIRLATGILIAPLRPAALLAKTAATLDALSGGRLELGVGTGWQAAEYEAVGLDFSRRGRLLTDTIAVCRALWEAGPASVDTPSLSFDDIWCEPRPVQDRLPVLFSGGVHGRNVARIVELGDGWLPNPTAPDDEVAAGVATLRSAYEAAGRDPGGLRVQVAARLVRGEDRAPDLGATMATVPALAARGVTDVNVNLRMVCPDLDRAPEVLADLRAAFDAAVDTVDP